MVEWLVKCKESINITLPRVFLCENGTNSCITSGLFAFFRVEFKHNNRKEQMYKTTKIAEWSKAVRLRDGKCKHCGSIDNLHAHHIKPKSTNPELSLDIDNGMTLCYTCHKAEHEKNRPVRIKTGRPQRRTLLRWIDQLEAENKVLKMSLKLFTDAQSEE